MRKRIVLISALMTVVLSSPWMSVKADSAIDMNTIMPFLYQGLSYLPLGGVADLLGAPLQWDSANNNATMNYQGEDLVLSPNSLQGMFAGQQVTLPSAPVVVNGVTYVPASVLKKYYGIPVSYDRNKSEVTIKGPKGWKKMKATTRTPWNNGPPPWAPAWGARRNGTPSYSNNGNSNGKGRIRDNKQAPGQGRYNAPGNWNSGNSNGKSRIKGNKQAPGQGRYNAPGNSNNGNSNGKGRIKDTKQAPGQGRYKAFGNTNNGNANGNGRSKGNKNND